MSNQNSFFSSPSSSSSTPEANPCFTHILVLQNCNPQITLNNHIISNTQIGQTIQNSQIIENCQPAQNPQVNNQATQTQLHIDQLSNFTTAKKRGRKVGSTRMDSTEVELLLDLVENHRIETRNDWVEIGNIFNGHTTHKRSSEALRQKYLRLLHGIPTGLVFSEG